MHVIKDKPRRPIAVLLAVALACCGWGQSAQAGNYLADFYLTGQCAYNETFGGWMSMHLTNYDTSPTYQAYHYAVTRSGTSRVLRGIYVDGKYVTGSAGDYDRIFTVPGHGPHAIKMTYSIPFKVGTVGCTKTL